MFLQNSEKKIEEEFLKLTEKLGADKEPLKTICGKLDACDRDLTLAMKYLYVTAPYSDLVNYSFEDIKEFLYNHLERVHALQEEMFLNYILDHRVNEEEVLPCRTLFWNALKDRIEGKNAKDAAIEVNYWCAEEATYHSGDDRTLPALTVYRRGYGRCGEESVFLVNALRSVGIPARQVYVPRWSHCDDNHAWVELWCDGKWYFTGACEPLMILNKGWFTNASSRAMMVHSRLFDLFPAEGEDVIGKEGAAVMLNQTARYAKVKTVTVQVTDHAGAPVKDAQVQFQVLNMGEYYPIAKAMTDENGNDVAYANSLWVYMDIERGRPARPDESEIAPYGTGEPYEMTYESRKIPLPTESEELESFPVRRYHIDTNEHVNNCQYVQMALESLPKDKEVHQMRVEYKKSAVYGDMIYPRIAAEDDRTVVELCDENAKPYAVIEFRFA